MKRAIVFDFDGTLADSLPVLLDSYNAIAPRYRLRKIKPSEIKELRKLSYRQMMSSVNVRPWLVPAIIRSATKQLRKRESKVKLFKGIPELLTGLIKDGHRVGILTSNHSDVVNSVLEAHSIEGMDFIMSQRSLFAKHKAFRKIEKVHNLKPSDIVYVGDEYRDVQACRKAGIEVIGVTWGLGGKAAFEREPADHLVNSVSELKKTLQTHYL